MEGFQGYQGYHKNEYKYQGYQGYHKNEYKYQGYHKNEYIRVIRVIRVILFTPRARPRASTDL